jgi:protocatechuate 3,4-dioxygenase beta subunit
MALYRYRLTVVAGLALGLMFGGCQPEGLNSPPGQPPSDVDAPTDETFNDETLTCDPTPSDSLGPFYEADAPIRDRVGEGYVLTGSVLSAENCLAISDVQIEFWLAGPDGEYRDDYRATLFSDDQGEFRFESHFPPPYQGRPSHIHIRVTAPGFQELVTQHYPEEGDEQATFNLVLVPTQ